MVSMQLLWYLFSDEKKIILINQGSNKNYCTYSVSEKKLLQLIRVKPKAIVLNQCYEKNNGT